MPEALDTIDRRILRELQRDARIPNTKLAEIVGLSPSPCLRRVRLLEEAGLISRYVALLDQARVGLRMTIFIRVTLERQDQKTVGHFASEVAMLPEVLEAYLMAGGYDFLLRVVVSDLEDYRRVHMDRICSIEGVRNIVTEMPLQAIKQTTALPL